MAPEKGQLVAMGLSEGLLKDKQLMVINLAISIHVGLAQSNCLFGFPQGPEGGENS